MSQPVRHVVLLGLMGVGKTSVGRPLSVILGWRLDDSDETIAREQGATVRELSEQLGVDGMHELEARHLLKALLARDRSVICAAASVVDWKPCREALRRRDVLTVWLQADPSTLASRFSSGPHRPVLGDDPTRLLRRQLQERASRFAAIESYRVVSEGRDPHDIALELGHLVQARRR